VALYISPGKHLDLLQSPIIAANMSQLLIKLNQFYNMFITFILRKQLSLYDHIWLCNIPKDREHYTQHGLHMNPKGKTFLTNKWMPSILAMTTRTQKIMSIPLPWTEGNVNSVASPVNKKTLASKSTKVAERNHGEPTVKLEAKQNSIQAYKNNKKTDLDHLVPNEDSTVKMATSESSCSSLTGASD
jgi:hypothetical protein